MFFVLSCHCMLYPTRGYLLMHVLALSCVFAVCYVLCFPQYVCMLSSFFSISINKIFIMSVCTWLYEISKPWQVMGIYITLEEFFPPCRIIFRPIAGVQLAGGGVLGGARSPPLLPAQRKIFWKLLFYTLNKLKKQGIWTKNIDWNLCFSNI